MHINWWTLALQTINVLILAWLLSRFLYRPVVAAIAARQDAANALLADAEAARAGAAAQEATLKARNDAFSADIDRKRADAQAAAQAERARLLDQARQDVADLRQKAQSADGEERARRGTALEGQAATLAGHMAVTLLEQLPVAAATDAMFDRLVARLVSLSDEERQQLVTGPLRIVTSGPLEAVDQTRYGKALAQALPGMATPTFMTEPTLIAGFELRNGQMILRNSWRSDLDAFLDALREDAHARIA